MPGVDSQTASGQWVTYHKLLVAELECHHVVRLLGQGVPSMPQPPETRKPPTPSRRRQALPYNGIERNSRITGLTGAVLVVLLAAEGATVLSIHRLLRPHVFIGMLLVPPVLVKMSSTGWRFARYYLGSATYRAKGPPPLLLRLLGPVVVLLTVVLFGSGIALLFVARSARSELLFVHKASFVLWFGAMTLHVLGHVVDTARLAPSDLVARTRRQVAGAGLRLWLQAAALVAGIVLGVVTLPAVTSWVISGSVLQGG